MIKSIASPFQHFARLVYTVARIIKEQWLELF
jgi:hypothetical protein